MSFYAVIDTNVVVSSMLKGTSIPGKVIQQALHGKIIPLIHEEILAEYENVINRPKFKFPDKIVEKFLKDVTERGKFIDAKEFEEELPDPKDKIFYFVTMTAREEAEAYLVTGNLKHFPIKPFIVSPREMLEILGEID